MSKFVRQPSASSDSHRLAASFAYCSLIWIALIPICFAAKIVDLLENFNEKIDCNFGSGVVVDARQLGDEQKRDGEVFGRATPAKAGACVDFR